MISQIAERQLVKGEAKEGMALSRGAESVNAVSVLRSKLSQVEDSQQSSVNIRTNSY